MRIREASYRRLGRRGVVMIAALICLLIVLAAAGATLQAIAGRRSFARQRAQRAQARFLAESALERTAAILVASPDYPGETWTVPADRLDGASPGTVDIEVRSVPDAPGSRLVVVRSSWPADRDPPVLVRKQVIIELASTENEP